MRMGFYQLIVSSQTDTKNFSQGGRMGRKKNRDAQIASKLVIN